MLHLNRRSRSVAGKGAILLSWLALLGSLLAASPAIAEPPLSNNRAETPGASPNEPSGTEPSEPEEPLSLIRAWSSPQDCIQREELLDRINREIEGIETHERILEGSLSPTESGWRAQIHVFEGDILLGTRTLSLGPDHCRSHDDTLTLVAALLLEHGPPKDEEPKRTTSTDAPAAESADRKADAEKTAASSPAASTRKEVSSPSNNVFRMAVGVHLLSGWLPDLGVGPSLSFAVFPSDALFFELRGIGLLQQEDEVFEQRAVVTTSAHRLQLRACAERPLSVLSVYGCADLGWMGLRATGETETDLTKTTFNTLEFGADVGLEWPLHDSFSFLLEGGLSLPFRRGSYVFEVNGTEELIHETAPLLGSGSVAASVRF